MASDVLDASYKEFSNERNKRIPSPLAKILIPFSFAETAKRDPSLLKRIRGLAWNSDKVLISKQLFPETGF
jgi:hypothetical protein